MAEPENLPQLLRQEVQELTTLLRQGSGWSGLRGALTAKHVHPHEVLLVSFHEDEEGNEYGLLLTAQRRIFEFVRSTSHGAAPLFSAFHERRTTPNLRKRYPQLASALELLEEGWKNAG